MNWIWKFCFCRWGVMISKQTYGALVLQPLSLPQGLHLITNTHQWRWAKPSLAKCLVNHHSILNCWDCSCYNVKFYYRNSSNILLNNPLRSWCWHCRMTHHLWRLVSQTKTWWRNMANPSGRCSPSVYKRIQRKGFLNLTIHVNLNCNCFLDQLHFLSQISSYSYSVMCYLGRHPQSCWSINSFRKQR